MSKLSHVDKEGKAKMVDVSDKQKTNRTARASVSVMLNSETFQQVRDNQLAKGDVLTVAKLAGIQAAKRTSELIPLCHPLSLSHVDLEFDLDESNYCIEIVACVRTSGPTGVEMEALTACSIAALTVYDMVKAIQKDVVIADLKLLEKTGGKSGDFRRTDT